MQNSLLSSYAIWTFITIPSHSILFSLLNTAHALYAEKTDEEGGKGENH